MNNVLSLDIEKFLCLLGYLPVEQGWTASLEKRCIHLRRTGVETIYSPLTAVYYAYTGKELHRGSFLQEEFNEALKCPWWDTLEISYAWTACDCGKNYSRTLRNRMLQVLELPKE